MNNIQEPDMPTPCGRCGEIFELNDGIAHENIIYCEPCGKALNRIAEINDEIVDLKNEIEDAKYTLKYVPEFIKNLEKEQDELGL